ncbi:PepSY domain-containing protein [Variovorax paradoxus]|uniref:PepSY domain-containing protein n=1 Tax=Variovorax paradoxus (strain S110) TaxID=543728 RepID=C5CUN2_VARPS|nr:PepSY domain-containing protein [Variovorax paradoxus]
MNKSLLFTVAAAAAVLWAAPASAQFVDHDAVKCAPVPKAEMRPQMELQRKLTSEGWKVRQVKDFNGCYEVYGFDEKGQRTEAFFDPKTFEKVGQVKQPS